MATSVQYLPHDNLTLGDFKTWAQSIGTALTAFGWSLDSTVNGMVNWSTILNWPGQDTVQLATPGTLNFRNAFNNTSTYAVADVVTFNGATWYCIVAYASTASLPTPGNEIGNPGSTTQHWRLFAFEVWKSAVTPTMYIRFEYLGVTGQTPFGTIRVTVGTSDDTNGNMGTGVGQQATTPFVLQTSNPGVAVDTGGNNFPCYFSGDTGNRFGMLMWDYSGPGITGLGCFFCVERSLDNTGAYYTSPSGAVNPYWTMLAGGYSATFQSQALINTTGTTWVKTNADTVPWVLAVQGTHNVQIESQGTATAGGTNQSLPAFPAFPMVGWVGNPMTVIQSFKFYDAPSDGPYTISMYGVSHTYWATRNSVFGNFGGSNDNGLALRYD